MIKKLGDFTVRDLVAQMQKHCDTETSCNGCLFVNMDCMFYMQKEALDLDKEIEVDE